MWRVEAWGGGRGGVGRREGLGGGGGEGGKTGTNPVP